VLLNLMSSFPVAQISEDFMHRCSDRRRTVFVRSDHKGDTNVDAALDVDELVGTDGNIHQVQPVVQVRTGPLPPCARTASQSGISRDLLTNAKCVRGPSGRAPASGTHLCAARRSARCWPLATTASGHRRGSSPGGLRAGPHSEQQEREAFKFKWMTPRSCAVDEWWS
jgi:hypothetical protein